MELSKIILTTALSIAISASSFASNDTSINPAKAPTETKKAVTTQIKTMIQKLDIDVSAYDSQTIKIKFLVNENDELIVLSTEDSGLDKKIKGALNYKEVDTTNVKHNKVYILPISFEQTDK